MKSKEMDKLILHFNTCFQQGDPIILHPIVMEPHIDVLKYPPTDKYPFWKLITMGASDFKLNGQSSLGNRNEYMIFIDAGENLDDNDTLQWYYRQLMEVAIYPIKNNVLVTYGHSLEWAAEAGEEMVGAFIEFPQIIENPGILRCQLGLFKTTVCLQVVLLNREEIDKLMQIGPQNFSCLLYPEDGNRPHYLTERKRSDKF